MLPKKYRLPIQNVLDKKGEVVRTPYFLVKIFSNTLPYRRFGIIISSSIMPKAVKRNALRRELFDAIERHFTKSGKQVFSLPAGEDFLIIALPKIKILNQGAAVRFFRETINRLFRN